MFNLASLPRQRGAAALEWLLAAPVILFLGFMVLQWALVFFARNAVEQGLQEGLRSGAMGFAQPSAIQSGLAKGLIPYWGLASSGQSLGVAQASAEARLLAEMGNGVAVLRQVAPTQEAFADWAVPARDANGDPLAGVIEIPQSGQIFQTKTVGAASGQGIRDANVLKLELRYGVSLSVPIVAPILVWILEKMDACSGAVGGSTSTTKQVGAWVLDDGKNSATASSSWRCPFYRAVDDQGNARLRWPLQIVGTMRMQTPARMSSLTLNRKENPLLAKVDTGPGTAPDGGDMAPLPGDSSSGGNPSTGAGNTGGTSSPSTPSSTSGSSASGKPTIGGSQPNSSSMKNEADALTNRLADSVLGSTQESCTKQNTSLGT